MDWNLANDVFCVYLASEKISVEQYYTVCVSYVTR